MRATLIPEFFSARDAAWPGITALGVLMSILGSGCDNQSTKSQHASQSQESVLEVGVIHLEPALTTLTQDLPGRTSPYKEAEIRARVTGIVNNRVFSEGTNVKKGDLLYEIEPSLYQATYDNARGAVAKAEAKLRASRARWERHKTMVAKKAVSQQDYDDAVAEQESDAADVISMAASLDTARINLDFTRVRSPIDGRIGVSKVTEGAYVRDSDATLLAIVQQLDPINVDVPQSTGDLLRLRNFVSTGEVSTNANGQARVRLFLEDGTEYRHEGVLQFEDVKVDASTNTVNLRARFPNPEHQLLPGMFVQARLVVGEKQDALLVPQSAVMRNFRGQPIAYVASDAGTVEQRILETPKAIDNRWLVTSGLNAGDQLIVNNLQRLRDGVTVKALPVQADPGPGSQDSR